MNFYTLTAFLNLITSLFIGIFVYLQNTRSIINKTFALFCFFILIWSAPYLIWQISNTAPQALFWVRGLMVGGIFVSISYFHFIVALINKTKEYKKYLLVGYPLLFLFFLANFTPYFVSGVTQKLQFPFWPEPGILFHPFLVLWGLFIVFTFHILFKEYRTATGKFKTQLRYILLGTIVGYFGGVTNYLLWYNIPIPPIGNWTTAFYLGIVAYAIVTQQLFNIRIVITQILVAIISVLLFINLVLSKTLFEYFWKGTLLIVFIIAGYLLIKSVMNEIKQRAQLQEAYKKLKELDQAKSEFVSIASHQLKTPLSAIKGYLSMILDKTYGEVPEKIEKPLKNVFISNERLIKLVNDLLSISRIEAGKMEIKMETLSVEEIISSVIEELKGIVKEKNLYLKFEKPKTPLPKILIDGDKIRQVILNLTDNAIKYTSQGGITVHVISSKSKVKITMSDTGEGMTKDDITKVFESFSRGAAGTRLYTEGAGLGLYVAKKFVEMHKGRVWVESRGKGKGSTFFIELPIK